MTGSRTSTCSSCRHAELSLFPPCGHEDEGVIAYECRRFPPQVFIDPESENTAVQSWPTMQADDWCGEHES